MSNNGKSSNPEHSFGEDRKKANGWMCMSVVSFSLFPVCFTLGNSAESPAWFTIVMWSCVLLAIALMLNPRALYRTWKTWYSLPKRNDSEQMDEAERKQRRRCVWFMIGGGIFGTDVFVFALAIGEANPVFAAMIFESWPVVLVLFITGMLGLLPRLIRITQNQWVTNWLKAALSDIQGLEKTADGGLLNLGLAFLMCFFGAILLTVGDAKLRPDSVYQLDGLGYAVLASAMFTAQIICNQLAARILKVHLEKVGVDKYVGYKPNYGKLLREPVVLSHILSYGLPRILSIPILLFIALQWEWDDGISHSGILWAIVAAGAAIAGAVPLRLAQHYSPNYGINLGYFFTPVLAAAWLWLIPYIWPWPVPGMEQRSGEAWDWILIGASAIVTGILLVGSSSERSNSFKGLVVSLWVFGLWAFWYDQPEHTLYYELVMVAVTMFVLLISFRRESLLNRIKYEETLLMSLWKTISLKGQLNQPIAAREILNDLYKSRSITDLRRYFDKLQEHLPPSDNESGKNSEFIEMFTHLGRLIHSKQRASSLGELISIVILGLLAIVSLLLFLPKDTMTVVSCNSEVLCNLVDSLTPVEPNTQSSQRQLIIPFGWLAELSAILISATIIFLLFSIHDLQLDRRRPLLYAKSSHPIFGATKEGDKELDLRNKERGLAAILSFVTTVIYAFVLYRSWLEKIGS